MFPDTDGFSIPLIPICCYGSVGYLSSVVQYTAMLTLVAGLQYIFRQQIASAPEDRQEHCHHPPDSWDDLDATPPSDLDHDILDTPHFDGAVSESDIEHLESSHFPLDVNYSQFDFPWPPTVNSSIGLQHTSSTAVTCPFKYRSLQE
jgi:hypothetical protein